MKVSVKISCDCKDVVGNVQCYLCKDQGEYQIWVPLTKRKLMFKGKRRYEDEVPALVIERDDLKQAIKKYRKKKKLLNY